MFIGICWYQDNLLDKYKNLIEQSDTITITTVDTLYLNSYITDTVPTVKWQTIIKTDTLYQKTDDDSIEAQPILISLKKKITQIQ